jgi:hypothetical protein
MAIAYTKAKYIYHIIMVSNIQFMIEMCSNEWCHGSIRASNSTYMLYYEKGGSITSPLINVVKNDVSTLKGEFIEDGLKLNLYSGNANIYLEFSMCHSSDIWKCPLLIKFIFTNIKQKEINNELTNKITELSNKIDAIVKKICKRSSWWTWW